MNNILVIFGATGDLMDKKISPALYSLNKDKPDTFHKIIGFGRRDLTDDSFREMVKTSVLKKLDLDESLMNDFLSKVEYHKGEFDNLESFKNLNQKISEKHSGASKHAYMAIPPEQYPIVINSLGESEFVDSNTKLMVEKPVGNDLQSSIETEELFSKYFSENQIYRIDHYLGKDSVQNILSFRFANAIFDPIWNNKYVEKIEIRMHETLGVENRGSFYDKVGALRDFGQSHALQLLALTAMDEPSELCCENIRDSRARLLKMVKPLTSDQVKLQTYRAQYQGYKSIENVDPNSQTETYFKVKCEIDSERWRGVPIYIESGKKMEKVNKEVMIYFKDVNKVIFSLEPEDSIKIFVKTKKPGINFENEDNMITLNMNHNAGETQYVAEYEELFYDFFNSDQTFFLSRLESVAMWEFTQPILDSWQRNEVVLDTYSADTNQATEKANLIIKS